jgi:hypothetical protein
LRLGFSKYVGPSVGLGYQVKLVKTPKKKDWLWQLQDFC